METKPFLLEGAALELNVDAREGSVLVEALDQEGHPLSGYTRSEAQVMEGVDELRLRPRWTSHTDLAELTGKGVRLKFHLRNARLYAFQVRR